MFLFFDVETNGLPKIRNGALDDIDNWPRVVQISWAIFEETGQMIFFKNNIIQARDFTINADSTKIHGISQERSLNKGVSMRQVLSEINLDLEKISLIICHNIEFDIPTLYAEYLRNRIDTNLLTKKRFCTMKSPNIVGFCQKPSSTGSGYKWPSLSELHEKLFGIHFEDSHNAIADVNACARCFFELKKRGIIC